MTLQELNTKWWYRFIKVLYGLSLVIMIIIGNIFVFSNGIKQLDLEESFVHCNVEYYLNKNRQGYKNFSLKDAGIYDVPESGLDNYKDLYTNSFYSYEIKKILSKCSGIDDITKISLPMWQLVSDIQKDKPSTTDTQAIELYNEKYKEFRAQGLSIDRSTKEAFDSLITYNNQLFAIETHYTMFWFILSFVLTNTIVLAVFEVIRRTFYYIFLGNLRPAKTLK